MTLAQRPGLEVWCDVLSEAGFRGLPQSQATTQDVDALVPVKPKGWQVKG